MNEKVLEVSNLSVSFTQHESNVDAVNEVNFSLYKGQSLGIVGESGSGKSVTSLSILNLFDDNLNAKSSGSISFFSDKKHIKLLESSGKLIEGIRGNKISMVFQEPMSSLNPVKKCGWQVEEVLEIHNIAPHSQRQKIVYDLFSLVQLDDVERIYSSYPHELSGGQLQRINIAMALAGNPEILICDEPTTALDVTIQKEIMDLLKSLIELKDLAMIFVCHDLDLVADICDSVIVMYQGEIVEKGVLPQLFNNPKHPYTKALLACKPKLEYSEIVLPTVRELMEGSYTKKLRKKVDILNDNEIVLTVNNLTVDFHTNPLSVFAKRKYFRAVDNVSFQVRKGEVMGIVGESGSGKSTIANCISGIVEHTKGDISYLEQVVNQSEFRKNRALRRGVQLIFQDPYSSLNPRMTIGNCIAEPIKYHKIKKGADILNRTHELLEQVGLDSSYYDRYPHELSGGQRQRVCIARALSVEPTLLICDESVSALDVSVQAQILNLLDRLKNEFSLTMIFISHDLSVVQYISDRVIVMKNGVLVEQGDAIDVITSPKEEYTRKLVESIPTSI